MEFLDKFALYPSENHLELLRMIFVLLFVVHIPYLGFVFGSALFSLLFHFLNWREENELHARFARTSIGLAVSNLGAVFLLGLIPLFTMGIVMGQLFQHSPFHVLNYFTLLFVLEFLGFLFLVAYQRALSREGSSFVFTFGLGLIGLALITGVLFHLSAVFSLVAKPEKWAFVNPVFPTFVTANVLPRFLLLAAVSVAFAAVAQGFLLLVWKKEEPESPFGNLVRSFCGWAALIFVLLTPILIVWNLYTLPKPALTGTVFFLWMVVLALLLIVAFALNAVLNRRKTALATAFVAFLLVYLSSGIAEQVTATNANREHEKVLALEAEKEHEKILEIREERLAALNKIDGEDVFKRICSACHKFDQRLVGPPFQSVIPKYRGNAEELVAFILNPVKKDPGYPPMPKPNVSKAEAKAVAEFLLKRLLGKPENPVQAK